MILGLFTGISAGASVIIAQCKGAGQKEKLKSVIYVRTYFAGILFSLVYNVGSGILYSFGDSKHPFYYLSCSSLINVILDLFFIKTLKLGVFGAALATILAQLVSAVLIVRLLLRAKKDYQIRLKEIKIQKDLVPEILHMGLPVGLQNTVVALSNVMLELEQF